MSQLTTHVLDTSSGKPAGDIEVNLYFSENNSWTKLAAGVTNIDGRISNLLDNNLKLAYGTYKMVFETGEYFKTKGTKYFYPRVEIIFEISSEEHYHIPLLLSPFGYITYRGS